MQAFFALAPPLVWLRVAVAALLILGGAVAFGHARVLKQGYGRPWPGILSPRARATAIRWTGVLELTGFALWWLVLGWPAAIVWAMLGAAGVLLCVEVAARLPR